MAKVKVREINPYAILYRDDRNGIAWIEDGSSGYGFIYNIDSFVCNKDCEFEMIVASECRCQGCIERRNK